MINIVLPMAGRGSRFSSVGYKNPKPLIEINGKSMIDIVIHNIKPTQEHRFIFLVLQEHLDNYDLKSHLLEMAPGSIVIPVNEVTEGPACTVLLSRKYIDNDDSLMIANCDQWIDINIDDYLNKMLTDNADGLIMTMKAGDSKWSYVGYDEIGHINKVVEKEVISDEATVGIYNFKKGHDFVKAADKMIEENFRVNIEFYVAPAYNILLNEKGYHITTYNIGSVMDGMYGLGTPEDLELFLKLPVCNKAIAF